MRNPVPVDQDFLDSEAPLRSRLSAKPKRAARFSFREEYWPGLIESSRSASLLTQAGRAAR